MIFALVAAALIQTATLFAPPLDQPLHVVTERVQTEGSDIRRYTATREIRFLRDGTGYRAEVTLGTASAEGPGDSDDLFESAFAAMAGRTIRFRLDGSGAVIAVDEREAVWAALCDAIIGVALARRATGNAAERAATTERIATPLRAMPAERQQAILASLIVNLIETRPLTAGTTPVRLPGRSPLGGSAMLDGTETVAREGTALRVERRSSGRVAVPGSTDSALLTSRTTRVIDPLSGLVRSATERVETRLGGRVQVVTTTARIAPN